MTTRIDIDSMQTDSYRDNPRVSGYDCNHLPALDPLSDIYALDGTDQRVQRWYTAIPLFKLLVREAFLTYLLDERPIVFHSENGRHRSVAAAVLVGEALQVEGVPSILNHRNLSVPSTTLEITISESEYRKAH